MPTITGTIGNDILPGTTGDDLIITNGGRDTVTADDGNDTVELIATTSGFGTLDGGVGTDTLWLNPATPQTIANGPLGSYSLSVGLFNNPAQTTITSFERFVFNSSVGSTMSSVFAYGGNNGALNQIGSGLAANAEIVGGAGSDTLQLSYNSANLPGTVTMPSFTLTNWTTPTRAYLGGDRISIIVSGSGATTINGTAHSGVQGLSGGAGDDIINGSDDMDSLSPGLGGNDILHGNGGNDSLGLSNTYLFQNGVPGAESTRTGAGSLFDGGEGTDFLALGGHVNFLGTIQDIEGLYLAPVYFNSNSPAQPILVSSQYSTNATFTNATFSAFPSDLIVDGAGNVRVNLAAGGDTFDGSGFIFETGSAVTFYLAGNIGADHITGTSQGDEIDGDDGADVIDGGAGDDSIWLRGESLSVSGGSGTDNLAVEGTVNFAGTLSGFEQLSMFPGSQMTLSGTQFAGGLASNAQIGGFGAITINMDSGTDFFSTLMTQMGGSDITFAVNGTSGSDGIKGGQFATTVNAGGGVDVIRTGDLVDTISGGDGNDKIAGRGGADILTGGAGADTFRYVFDTDSGLGANADHITDFAIGTDKLAFRALDPDLVTPGIQAFTFIDSQAFHATGAAEIHYANSGADLLVEADLNGDGIADMQIVLNGLAGQALTSVDFLL